MIDSAAPDLSTSAPVDAKLTGLVDDIATTCDLPPLPAAAARALSLARDPESSSEDLARVVATDPALAARVLAMSRSVTYLRRQPPRTLQEAIATVGLRALRRILIAASARAAYRADDQVAQSLWAHSLAAGLAADELGKAMGGAAAGDAFIAGLLHDIGKLVLHLSNPAAFATLGVFDEAEERRLFGTTHAEIGGRLAEKWGLEPEIVQGILGHHAAEAGSLAACVETADRLAIEIGYGSLATHAAPPPTAEGEQDADFAAAAERVKALFESERHLFD